MPWYRTHGKILTPISNERYAELMNKGKFVKQSHRGYVVLLWYSAIRREEALRSLRPQYQKFDGNLLFSVGKRLKHGIETAPLPIPLDAPFVDDLIKTVKNAKSGGKVFNFSPMTAYNICSRLGYYPHFFRLNRITRFFSELNPATNQRWTIAQLHSWTGLTLSALNYYLGLVDVADMGRSLGGKQVS